MVLRECAEHPRGYLNTPELACIDAFERAAREIAEWHDYQIPQADIRDFIANITSMVSHVLSPDEYFDYIQCGTFKECYEGLGKWVIKFASNHNETGAERQILDAAVEAGLSFMFLPTKFIDLPVQLPAEHLDGGCNYYRYDCTTSATCEHHCSDCQYRVKTDTADTYLITAELQPRGFTCDSIAWENMPCNKETYDKNPLILQSGEKVPFNRFEDLDIHVISWLRDIIATYGDKNFWKLYDFILKFGISDMHEHNIGYVTTAAGDMPVFLDWLSREEGPSETSSH